MYNICSIAYVCTCSKCKAVLGAFQDGYTKARKLALPILVVASNARLGENQGQKLCQLSDQAALC